MRNSALSVEYSCSNKNKLQILVEWFQYLLKKFEVLEYHIISNIIDLRVFTFSNDSLLRLECMYFIFSSSKEALCLKQLNKINQLNKGCAITHMFCFNAYIFMEHMTML